MKFTADQKAFSKALQRVIPAVSRESAMPVLQHVLLTATDGSVTLRANDTTLEVTTAVDAQVATPGAVAVPGKELLQRIKAMPEGTVAVTVTADEKRVTVTGAGKRRYRLPCLDAQNYPPAGDSEGDAVLSVPAQKLGTLLDLVTYAMSTDETRAHLNAVHFETDAGKLIAVATDGHRLAKADVEIGDGDAPRVELLLMARAATELRKLCAEAKEGVSVEIVATKTSHRAVVGATSLSVRRIDAAFPAYQQVIPHSHEVEAVPLREELLSAVRAVGLAAAERTSGIKVQINGAIKITAETQDGDGHDEVHADISKGAIAFGVSARLMADALAALDTEQVEIQCTGELDPVVVLPVAPMGYGAVGVVMPMRV